jgi:hypothetical protein
MLLLVAVLWVSQQALFPGATLAVHEGHNILAPRSGGPVPILTSLCVHTLIMPQPIIRPSDGKTGRILSTGEMIVPPRRLVTQGARPGSGSRWGQMAALCWVVLLGVGLRGLWTGPGHQLFRVVLAVTLLGQVGLHLLYGDETFLYTPHFLPLLLLVVAFGLRTMPRAVRVLMLALLVTTTGLHNWQQFQAAVAFLLQMH